jgi:hypothetical protein
VSNNVKAAACQKNLAREHWKNSEPCGMPPSVMWRESAYCPWEYRCESHSWEPGEIVLLRSEEPRKYGE